MVSVLDLRKNKQTKNPSQAASSVSVYNKFMGDVDKADMLLSLYRTKYRSHKWYHRIVFHLFSLATTSAWIVYKEMGGIVPLVKFLDKICQSLICSGQHVIDESDEDIDQPRTKRLLRAQDIPIDIRYDKYNHWPVLQDIPNSQHSKYEESTKKTKYQCSRCKVFLCVQTINHCFTAFHGVEIDGG